VGMVIPKGSWPQVRAAGLEALRRTVVELVPWLAGRVEELADWTQVSLLSVTADRLPKWYRPGLLLIGDAAHVMSPVAGNGINYAIADAVAAANLLARPLATGQLTELDLAAVQRRRQWPTRITQKVVGVLQDRLLAGALRSASGPPKLLRGLLRVPLLRDVAPRLAAFGARPEHVRSPRNHTDGR
jgi:2-polyprenyl-6-methoxyphenol hydroxylase-like FAD-dependent oxidoreductase